MIIRVLLPNSSRKIHSVKLQLKRRLQENKRDGFASGIQSGILKVLYSLADLPPPRPGEEKRTRSGLRRRTHCQSAGLPRKAPK